MMAASDSGKVGTRGERERERERERPGWKNALCKAIFLAFPTGTMGERGEGERGEGERGGREKYFPQRRGIA